MTDRFKFRVIDNRDWSTEKGKMYYNAEDTYDYCGEIEASCFGSLISEEWILEQCTGIYDSNGKLIYEGDIVTDGADNFEVFWDYNAWCIQTNKVQHFLTEGFELIGNIHENKELLDE